MRGGTSKGVFFTLSDLPDAAQQAGNTRDNLLLRVIGSPDPYGKQTDGMGGATSSTSKIVILSKSTQDGHDVDYLFGQVAIDKAFIDWSGNCGNLSSAVGSYAIANGLVSAERIPENGIAEVRIWQANIKKSIVAHVPITNGEVQETGDFELDGVTFPAAEVQIDFIQPVDANDALFPTGKIIETLAVPDIGNLTTTMINAGIPTIFLDAEEIGYTATELQGDINNVPEALAKFEAIRTQGALQMGLIKTAEEAATRQHTPKIAFVGTAQNYTSSSGKTIHADDIDLNVRALSMGLLHHAMMGTAAVAIASAASVPGTLVQQFSTKQMSASNKPSTNSNIGSNIDSSLRSNISSVTFGHPSGILKVGAEAQKIGKDQADWTIKKVSMSRSARILMEGWVRIPRDAF